MEKELMIGNYILGNYTDYGDFDNIEKQEICTVLSLDSVGVNEYPIWVEGESGSIEHYDSFEPISLTEEWLIKFGFEKGSDIMGDCFYIESDKSDDFSLSVLGNGFYIHGIELSINNVHQLQNLYYVLTGEQLTIKKQ